MKEKIDYRIVITALICLTLIEMAALFNGINGKLLIIVMSIIAGLAGWAMPQLRIKSLS